MYRPFCLAFDDLDTGLNSTRHSLDIEFDIPVAISTLPFHYAPPACPSDRRYYSSKAYAISVIAAKNEVKRSRLAHFDRSIHQFVENSRFCVYLFFWARCLRLRQIKQKFLCACERFIKSVDRAPQLVRRECMKATKGVWIFILLIIVSVGFTYAQDKDKDKAKSEALTGTPVVWEAVDISTRDLYWGPGGQENSPVLKGAKFIGRDIGGNNLKYEIEDGAKHRWIVKVARESQPEVAANRLLWAIGYPTEIDYVIPKINIAKVGSYSNVRFELRPDGVKRGERWSWMDNPFKDSRELRGLKIMMALINNWDLKDQNTVTVARDGKLYYVVSDLGASFGKLADKPMSRSGRSVNDPDDYAKASFIKGTSNGILQLDYRGINENVIQDIKVEDGRWLADLLLQLSDKQISDAFRAANYKPQEIQIYAQAVRTRIAALDKATQAPVAAN